MQDSCFKNGLESCCADKERRGPEQEIVLRCFSTTELVRQLAVTAASIEPNRSRKLKHSTMGEANTHDTMLDGKPQYQRQSIPYWQAYTCIYVIKYIVVALSIQWQAFLLLPKATKPSVPITREMTCILMKTDVLI
jgi:hypothetical protein